jgi:hypothetical protein
VASEFTYSSRKSLSVAGRLSWGFLGAMFCLWGVKDKNRLSLAG